MLFNSYDKGLTLSNASQIRSVHNSFARQTLFELDNKSQKKDDDLFHFVGYIPIDGRLYELDGLREGPVDLGAVGPDDDWLDVVRPIIESRMKEYSEGEIQFNLMGIVSDRQMVYQRQIDKLLSEIDENAMETDTKHNELTRLRLLIDDDIAKKKRYKVFFLNNIIIPCHSQIILASTKHYSQFCKLLKLFTHRIIYNCFSFCIFMQIENIRRKHNYLPFIVELLKLLGEHGQLTPIYEKAKQRAVEREASGGKGAKTKKQHFL